MPAYLNKSWNEKDVEYVRRRSVEGARRYEIAAELGRGHDYVTRIRLLLRNRGVQITPRTLDEILDLVADHARRGIPCAQTQAELGCGRRKLTQYRNMLRARGVSLKRTNFKHGLSGYQYYRCRCDICTAALAEQHRTWSCRIKKEIAAGAKIPSHGPTGYNYYGCRCDICTTGAANARKPRSAANQ